MAKNDANAGNAPTDAETDESSTAKARTAPAPDDSRKPDSPTDVTKPSWKYIAKKTLREFTKDQCPDLAAALTYYAVLSLFPALLALVSLLGIFGQAGEDHGGAAGDRPGLRPGRHGGRHPRAHPGADQLLRGRFHPGDRHPRPPSGPPRATSGRLPGP